MNTRRPLFCAGFHIRVVVAGDVEAERRTGDHRDHGRRLGAVVGHVRHGGGQRAARAHGRPPAGHARVSGGRLRGVRRVRRRAPVPQGVRAGARVLRDGRLAGLLDGVPDGGAHDAGVQNGVRAVRPGGVRAGRQRAPRGGGQEPGQGTAGDTRTHASLGLGPRSAGTVFQTFCGSSCPAIVRSGGSQKLFPFIAPHL